jgi:hypothetical protein
MRHFVSADKSLSARLGATVIVLLASMGTAPAVMAQARLEVDQLSDTLALDLKGGTLPAGIDADGGGVLGRRTNGNVLGVDSLQNFSSYFYFPGVIDQFGDPQFTWPYTMVGRAPSGGESRRGRDDDRDGNRDGTTWISAPIVPVTVDLRTATGAPRFVNGHQLIMSPAPFVNRVLKSPVFDVTSFDSSERKTQFTDAVHRAQFFHMADDDWHTMLKPAVKAGRTMIIQQSADPMNLNYFFSLNQDGTCCLAIFIKIGVFESALFPSTPEDTTTVIGAAEHGHDITTADLSTFLFPNTFLFFPGFPTTPGTCCVTGFHSYDVEPGDAANGWRERRYVVNYSSWISPGVFRDQTVGDVTALSHEVAETFSDPFGNNATPWWLSPNGLCQNNLETGDVIEGLSAAQFPITMNGFTYHPQNEALLQWFAGIAHSNAIHAAYSYPDTTVLTSPAVSQPFNCSQ